MPTIPFTGVPSVGPQAASTPRYTADVSGDTFGANVGHAMQGLGKSVEGAGNELFQRAIAMQDLNNHSEALEADAKYSQAAGETWEKMKSLQGKQAVDYFTSGAYADELANTRKGIREGLSNPMSQKLFDSTTLGTFTRTNLWGAGHTASENKKYALGASDAKIGAVANRTLSMPADEQAFRSGLQDAETEVRAQGQLKGLAPEAVEESVSETKSNLWAQRIKGLVKEQPIAAGKMLEQGVKAGDIRGEAIGQLTNMVQSARNTVGARMISNTVSGGAGMDWGKGTVDLKQAAQAIKDVESNGGNYNTIGVMTKHGRALGAYQVMEEYLPEFLSKAGLPGMTAKEFLGDHAAQDQVFSANFGAYMKQTGSANDAASMWFTGKAMKEAVASGVTDAAPGYKGIGANEYVTRFNKSLAKNAPLSAKVDMGTRIAGEQAPDDPLFPDYVRDRISADHSKTLQMKRDDNWQAQQPIETALMGSGQDGKLPTTVEELTTDPKVASSWEYLAANNPVKLRYYEGVLSRNAKGDVNWDPGGNRLREFGRLKGMAQVNPAEFIDTDVIGMDLPNSAKKELQNLQIQLKGKAEGDPRVARALNILKPDMQAAGIDPKDKEAYYQFTGALSDQLKEFADQNKRPPKIEEVQLIGSRLMQSTKVPGMLWGTNDVPTYSVPVPSDEAEKIKADPAWTKLAITPTDTQIQRIYTRKLYQDLYGGSPKVLVPVSK